MSWQLSQFRAGDLVEIRSREEILATLDEHGRLDGMPFMPEMLAFCFADDAVVRDEGRDHRGIEAIKAWKMAADAKYTYVLEALNASVTDKSVVVRARLTGNFPGSPVELDHTFTLVNGKITSLEIR